MPEPTIKHALPALGRGLHILDRLIRSEEPVRYNELRTSLPGVQDSTLSRILKALEIYGYISRDPDNGYAITDRVRSWNTYLNPAAAELSTLAQKEVDHLAELGEESAAVVQLVDDRILTLCSRSINGGIQVLTPGDLLHFEPDHAAAISVLTMLSATERKHCLKSPYNQLPKKPSLQSIRQAMRQDDGSLIDRSQARPGVCRMAMGFKHGNQTGAIFFCLTLEACEGKRSQLATLLQAAVDRLQR